jgi:hypothetical protein
MKATVCRPPVRVFGRRSVFLAGSIEMGTAVNWQEEMTQALTNENILILNPRREDWDSSWVQSIDDPKFFEQVWWELDGIENADLVAMHFVADTKSPITLLELGLLANTRANRLVVSCPKEFWRRSNVEIVCRRYGIELVSNLYALTGSVRQKLEWLNARDRR